MSKLYMKCAMYKKLAYYPDIMYHRPSYRPITILMMLHSGHLATYVLGNQHQSKT